MKQDGCAALECPPQWALPSSPPSITLIFGILLSSVANEEQWVKGHLSPIYMKLHYFLKRF